MKARDASKQNPTLQRREGTEAEVGRSRCSGRDGQHQPSPPRQPQGKLYSIYAGTELLWTLLA